MDVEVLAMILHEAGREAVEKCATVAAEHLCDQARTFIEWGGLTEVAKEGRRIQARYLIARGIGFTGTSTPVENSPVPPPPKIDVSGRHTD